MKIFVLEGFFMGLIGSLLGVVIGGSITYYYSQTGLYVEVFAEMMGEQIDLLVEPVFYFGFNLENLMISFVLTLIIVILACLYPARRAAKMEPVEALHVEE